MSLAAVSICRGMRRATWGALGGKMSGRRAGGVHNSYDNHNSDSNLS